ncbi:MAG TPA: guanylate kinase [Caulobacteraceae bacterium]|nr:guanylate kinase [Caulobacteraceae bacterium]
MSSEPARRGLLLVISSPSGAGKTTLSRRLAEAHGEIALSISVTTRPPRPGEVDGREYRFLSRAAFDAEVTAGAFLEWAEVHEHRYGTPRLPVVAAIEAGGDVLFDIDWQGAAAIHAAAPGDTVRIFILPPSMEALERRLHARAQDHADVISRRLGRARGEIAHWAEYDYVIVNGDFEQAYRQIESIYLAERLRRVRNPWLGPFVNELIRS